MTQLKQLLLRSGPPLLVGLATFAASGRTAAYQTLGSELGLQGRVGWTQPSVGFQMGGSLPSGLSTAQVEAEFVLAASAWQVAACQGPTLSLRHRTDAGAFSGDGRNTIEFVHTGWVQRGFESTQAAVADITVSSTGSASDIREADIYINAEHFDWQASTASGPHKVLRPMFVHELGHVLGLSHICDTSQTPPCGPEAAGLAMNPEYDPALTGIADDDELGLCAIYAPSSCDTTSCECTAGSCPEGAVCAEGACVQVPVVQPGTDEFGDPCDAADGTCSHGLCSAEGYCTESCVDSEECGSEGACSNGYCVGGELGAACSDAAECRHELCLVAEGVSGTCTRQCDAPNAACPGGYTCDLVGREAVCVAEPPVSHSSDASCSAGSGPSPQQTPYLTLLALLGAAWRRRHSQEQRL